MRNLEMENETGLKTLLVNITTNLIKDVFFYKNGTIESAAKTQYCQLIEKGFSVDQSNMILELCLTSFDKN